MSEYISSIPPVNVEGLKNQNRFRSQLEKYFKNTADSQMRKEYVWCLCDWNCYPLLM